MDDRTLNSGDKVFGCRAIYIIECEATHLVCGGVVHGDDGIQTRIGIVWMGMTKFELTEFRMAVCLPAIGVGTELGDISPAKRFLRPAQCFCLRFPHGNNYWTTNQRWGICGPCSDQLLTTMLGLPL